MRKERDRVIDYLKKRPMLLCGICASVLCIIGFYSRVAIFFIGITLILLFFFFLQKSYNKIYAFIIFVLIIISVSMLSTFNKIDKISESDGAYVHGSFIVLENSVCYGDYYSSVVKAADCDGLRNGTRVLIFSSDGGFECGDKISASAKLSAVGEKYRASDYSEKIYLTGNAEEVTVLSEEKANFLSLVNKTREYIINTLFSSVNYEEAATLTALVLGDRSYISKAFYGNIKAAGVSHIMVVSGLHLAVIVWLITGIIEKLIYNRFLKAFTVVMTVLFMSALCGFTKSIIRAGVCYILYAVSIVLKRDNTPENTLGGAVSLILIAEPFAIFSISFQLSALSTLGITAVALPITDYIKKDENDNGLLTCVVSSAVVTLSALLFTLPVTAYVFGYISTVSVASNMLISYAVTLALSFSAVGLVAYLLLPFAAQMFFTAAELSAKYTVFIINLFGSLPFSVIRLGKYAFVFAIFLLFSVIFILFACKRRQDMLKLKIMRKKIISEGGGRLIWR
ncbi:MAG: ComEC/Rec2 family competence protein [Acutalibacteraceae bacterium]